MTISLKDASNFAESNATLGATAEATRTMQDLAARGEPLPKNEKPRDEITPDEIRGGTDGAFRAVGEYEKDGDEGKLTAKLLGAAGNFLPADISKMLPLAQFALDGSWTKFLSGDKKAVEAALAALGKILPPELAKLLGKAGPLLTKGLESLLSGGGLPDLSKILSPEGLLGIAAQFLPPWAGDALAVGKELYNNFPKSLSDLAGSLDSLVGKFLPPELQAAWKALQDAGGLKGLLALFDERPNLQSPDGPWAARVTDLVECPTGKGAIISGLATVQIGKQFAARVTDVALCPPKPVPDILDHGEPSVIFGGQWATRKGDLTLHTGTITTGFPKVHIGKAIGNCGDCLKSGSSGGGTAATAGAGAGAGGAATISGAGITGPFTAGNGFENIVSSGSSGLGDIASGLGDMAKNKIADFAKQKAGELAQKVLGNKDKEVYDGSDYDNPGKQKPVEKRKSKQADEKPKPQPKISDDND